MTPDDMNPTPHPGGQPPDAPTAEAVLGAARPSGDAALDAVLDSLRDLGSAAAPVPTGELATLLGLPGSSGAYVSQTSAARARRARHVATGTTAVAGILLVTATAAAALGTLREAQSPARPTLPPAVVVPARPELPHPAGTGAGELPAVPAAATVAPGTSSTPVHRRPAHHPAGTSPRRAADDGEDSREGATGREDGRYSPHPATSESPDGDDATERETTGTLTHEDDSDDPTPTSTDGGHDGDDSSWTSTSDDGSDGGSDDGSDGGHGGDDGDPSGDLASR
jgi:hypothetical protein